MFDRYTKIVLTVIAVALSAIAVQGTITTARAAFGEGCGAGALNPCYVDHIGIMAGLPDPGMRIEVTNWPDKQP